MLRRLTSEHLSRFVAFGLVTAVLAGQWDIWWHVGIGRDSFWEPPHMLLYGGVWCAIIAGVLGWRKFGDPLWRRLGTTLAIVPLLAPFDELWHAWFGVENLMTPLVVWAPPHVLLIISLFAALVLVLPVIRKDPDPGIRRLLLLAVYAAALQLLLILAIPFVPIGAYHVAGPYGSLPMAFVIALFFLLVDREMHERGAVVLFAFVSVVFVATGIEDRTAPEILIPVHEHLPPWLSVFSYLIPAVFLSLANKLPQSLRGALVGMTWAAVSFGCVPYFYKALDPYGSADMLAMIVSAAAGGVLAGWVAFRYSQSIGIHSS